MNERDESDQGVKTCDVGQCCSRQKGHQEEHRDMCKRFESVSKCSAHNQDMVWPLESLSDSWLTYLLIST